MNSGLSDREHRHRLAYAERHHEYLRLRVIQAQIRASIAMAHGEDDKAMDQLQIAQNYIEFMDDCNHTIDIHRRALDHGDA